ncbi:Hint domain-containing protein [Enterocloster bolteae]|uniref:Hint domain-containing protein n=1 Tax=Enterocloster bolteae TaxID=208479 RepID=UPI0034A1024E
MNCKNGCLNENTMVIMSDGTNRRIKDLRVGNIVNGTSGENVRIENIWRGYEEELIELKLENEKQLSITKDHPIITNEGVVRAITIKAGDLLLTVEGYVKVVSVENIKYESNVYNLSLSDRDNTFWAEGIAVGDIEIQNRLPF